MTSGSFRPELDQELAPKIEAEEVIEDSDHSGLEPEVFLDDSLQLYMNSVGEQRLLTRKDEISLSKLARELGEILTKLLPASHLGQGILAFGYAQRWGESRGTASIAANLNTNIPTQTRESLFRIVTEIRKQIRGKNFPTLQLVLKSFESGLAPIVVTDHDRRTENHWAATMGIRMRLIGSHHMSLCFLGPTDIEIITAQDEMKLEDWKMLQQLCSLQDIRNRFIGSSLRLVISIAKRFQNQGLAFPDLIQEGNIGLLKAVETFDASKGKRFSSHATWFIRTGITKAIQDKGRLIRLPEAILDKLHKIDIFCNRFRTEHGEDPTELEIAAAVHLTLSELRDIMIHTVPAVSMDESLGESEVTVGETIADPSLIDITEVLQEESLQNLMENLINGLDKIEKDIIVRRFGLLGHDPMSHEEVAQLYSVNRDRVRNIERKALQQLRKVGNGQGLRDFLEEMEE